MANGKKSFVLYADLLTSVEHLTNEELGVLFKHILEYVNDKNPVLEDRLLLTAWKPIERSLKFDLEKWDKQLQQRRDAGKKSAEKRKRALTTVDERKQASTDSVSVTVNEIVSILLEDTDRKQNTIDTYSLSNKMYERLAKDFANAAAKQTNGAEEQRKHFHSWIKFCKLEDYNEDLPPIDRIVAVCALQSNQELERLKTKGYTLEQIKQYAE